MNGWVRCRNTLQPYWASGGDPEICGTGSKSRHVRSMAAIVDITGADKHGQVGKLIALSW